MKRSGFKPKPRKPLKRSPLKRKGKSEYSKAKAKAWKAFSLYIRTRDNFTCYTCGTKSSGKNIHAGHFISRSHQSTFLDEMNVHAQCYPCNIMKKGNAGIYAENLIRDYGMEKFQALLKGGREIKQYNVYELEALADQFEYKLKKLSSPVEEHDNKACKNWGECNNGFYFVVSGGKSKHIPCPCSCHL